MSFHVGLDGWSAQNEPANLNGAVGRQTWVCGRDDNGILDGRRTLGPSARHLFGCVAVRCLAAAEAAATPTLPPFETLKTDFTADGAGLREAISGASDCPRHRPGRRWRRRFSGFDLWAKGGRAPALPVSRPRLPSS